MDNNNNYYNILVKNHNNFINDMINTYFVNEYKKQILTYFKIYFFYYLITSYVYKPELNINEIKQVFILWLNNTLEHKNKKYIIKNFEFHHNYLFNVFFIKKNIYFHVYFNNLIKYFLPLPFNLNAYSPIITYRNNVNTFYKKNNIDYLDTINDFDKNYKFVEKYNADELDIHIPLKFFNTEFFNNYDVIYLIAKKDKLYICNKELNILYERNIDILNYKKYLDEFINGSSFEEIFPIWKKEINKQKFNDIDNLDKIYYISVMRKISENDLFNVFPRYNLFNDKYKYLFHNSLLNEKTEFDLSKETFFYLIPSSKSKYFNQEAERKCIIFKINKNINNLLDLTLSIITNNNFTNNMIIKDKKNKKWISYDPLQVLNYHNNEPIATKFDENFKCLTVKKSNLFDRPYCDVNKFGGRRKLQEILFKTRKYKYKYLYLQNIKNNDSLDKFKIYHPPNIDVKNNWDFDKYILKLLNYNGFFFGDYGDAVDGGEILLIHPNNYLSIYQKLNKHCY
jgi:hypothetical protein